jgi:prenyltransferase beta subunit
LIILILAGLTYCAVASYIILDKPIRDMDSLTRWLCSRLTELGVNGRTGKIPDSCYVFWVFGTLCNIKKNELFNKELATEFLLYCQTLSGGFSKHLNFDKTEKPDFLHTFYSLASLALLKYF